MENKLFEQLLKEQKKTNFLLKEQTKLLNAFVGIYVVEEDINDGLLVELTNEIDKKVEDEIKEYDERNK